MNVSIHTLGVRQLMATLTRAQLVVRQEQTRAMQRAVILVEADLKQHGLAGRKGFHPFWGVTGAAGDALGVRTGRLRASVRSAVAVRGNTVVGAVGTPSRILAIHERGADIYGRPFLWVPTISGQTAAGIARRGRYPVPRGAPPRRFPLRHVHLRPRQVLGQTLHRTYGRVVIEMGRAGSRIAATLNRGTP